MPVKEARTLTAICNISRKEIISIFWVLSAAFAQQAAVIVKLAQQLHPLVHQFANRTNAATADAHKIFIHDTCFIIRIDPLPSAPSRH